MGEYEVYNNYYDKKLHKTLNLISGVSGNGWSIQYLSRYETLHSNLKNIWTLPEYMVNIWLVTGVLALQHVVKRFIDPLGSSHHMVSPLLTLCFPVQRRLIRTKVAGDGRWGHALNTKTGKKFFKIILLL